MIAGVSLQITIATQHSCFVNLHLKADRINCTVHILLYGCKYLIRFQLDVAVQ